MAKYYTKLGKVNFYKYSKSTFASYSAKAHHFKYPAILNQDGSLYIKVRTKINQLQCQYPGD